MTEGARSSPPVLPNFFLLGAARSGTTSLARLLGEHPDIFIPEIKEPTFFASSFQLVKDPAEYVALYASATSCIAVGDASHIYLSDPESAPTLRAFFPNARFLLVFRDPAERALALYSYMVENGYEICGSFERAVAAEDRRFHSARFRQTCPQAFWNFMYVRSGFYGEQVERYLRHFDPAQFTFTTLDQLVNSTNDTMRGIYRFLGVHPIDVEGFPRHASSRGVRSPAVQYAERRVIEPLSRRSGRLGAVVRTRVNRLNRGTGKPTMSSEMRLELAARFEPDLKLLKELTGVDLLDRS